MPRGAPDFGGRTAVGDALELHFRELHHVDDYARLLGLSGWTAGAVAAHLRFPDAAGFGRFFRNRTGLTPAAYADSTPFR